MTATASHPSTTDRTNESVQASRPSTPPPARSAQSFRRLGWLWLLLSAAGVAGGWWYWKGHGAETAIVATAPIKAAEEPWDGLLTLSAAARQAIGVALTPVEAQTQPIRLPLLGTTKYDEDTLTRIRLMFPGRAEFVHVKIGETVKKDQPLVDVYSTELAEAKINFEIQEIKWSYSKNLLRTREALVASQSIPEQLFLETKNDEMRHRREMEVTKDRLLIYGLTDDEVGKVQGEVGAQKARMTIRSPANGIVIDRTVVPGNLYDQADTLLTIAPLDHLWVWGNVFESDLDLVNLGQRWEIQFPFMTERLEGKIEYVSNRVDPGTHAVRIRTSIPNREGRLKSDMLVQGALEIPPVPGRTVVPRSALVVANGRASVFVQSPSQDRFERRIVNVAHEKEDYAVIESGLKPNEQVVTVGSLILAQIYDDLRTRNPATPVDGRGVD